MTLYMFVDSTVAHIKGNKVIKYAHHYFPERKATIIPDAVLFSFVCMCVCVEQKAGLCALPVPWVVSISVLS